MNEDLTREKRGLTLHDLEKRVAQQVIDLLEADGLKWTNRWATPLPPMNFVSKHVYTGGNVLTTGIWMMVKGQSDPRFATFKQILAAGGTVRKGSKGIPIVFFKTYEAKDKETGEGKIGRVARVSYVFHASDAEGLDLPALPEARLRDDLERCDELDAYVAATRVKVREGSAAYYTPSIDTITMPPIGLFLDTESMTGFEAYYSTLMHELIHATGESGRAHRPDKALYHTDDKARAFEELVAEIGAAMLCQKHGITKDVRQDHAAYVKSWIRLLTDKPDAIFSAAAQASRGIAWIDAQQPQQQQKEAA